MGTSPAASYPRKATGQNVPAEVIVEAVRHATGMAKAVKFMNKTKRP